MYFSLDVIIKYMELVVFNSNGFSDKIWIIYGDYFKI